MKKFREITDDLQRFKFYLDLLPAGMGLLNLKIDFLGQVPSYICILISILLLSWHFSKFVWKWNLDNKKSTQSQSKIEETKPVYISFQDAIKLIGDCGYYDVNGHTVMHQKMGVTRDSYYKGLLQENIKRKDISLYGRKIHSSITELQKIEANEFKELYLENDCNFLSSPYWSQNRENVYTDLNFEKNELNSLVEKLKQELYV